MLGNVGAYLITIDRAMSSASLGHLKLIPARARERAKPCAQLN
jgi:hypothetical protein